MSRFFLIALLALSSPALFPGAICTSGGAAVPLDRARVPMPLSLASPTPTSAMPLVLTLPTPTSPTFNEQLMGSYRPGVAQSGLLTRLNEIIAAHPGQLASFDGFRRTPLAVVFEVFDALIVPRRLDDPSADAKEAAAAASPIDLDALSYWTAALRVLAVTHRAPYGINEKGVPLVGGLEARLLDLLHATDEATFPYVLDALWTSVLANGFRGFCAVLNVDDNDRRGDRYHSKAVLAACGEHTVKFTCYFCEGMPDPKLKPHYVALQLAFEKVNCFQYRCPQRDYKRLQRVRAALVRATKDSITSSGDAQRDLTASLLAAMPRTPLPLLHIVVSYFMNATTEFENICTVYKLSYPRYLDAKDKTND